MKKKIISGISLVLVLVMFAIVLSGCYEELFIKKGISKSSNQYIGSAEVIFYQYEDDGKYEDKYQLTISVRLKQAPYYYWYSGNISGKNEKELSGWNNVTVISSQTTLPSFKNVDVKVKSITKDAKGKATDASILIKHKGEEVLCSTTVQ